MKSRTGLLILIAALLIVGAGLAILSSSGGSPVLPKEAPTKPDTAVGRADRKGRFAHFDPALKQTVRQLETSAEAWRKLHLHGFEYLKEREWQEFARAQMSELDTEQLIALAAALNESGDAGDITQYRQAIYFVWGFRDPAASKAYALQTAAEHGFLAEDSQNTFQIPAVSICSDNLVQALLGRATRDPEEALLILDEGMENPALYVLMQTDVLLPGIFEIYSAKDPGKAWQVILEQYYAFRLGEMLEGFGKGVAGGQDWENLETQLSTHDALGGKRYRVDCSTLAGRWVLEDPEQALDFFVRKEAAGEFLQDPFSQPIPPDFMNLGIRDDATRARCGLLRSLFDADTTRMPETVAALQHLASHGQDVPVIWALSDLAGTTLPPLAVPLLAVLPQLPASSNRTHLVIQIDQAIRPGEKKTFLNDPFADDSSEHKISLDALRNLVAETPFPDEVKKQLQALTIEVEASAAEIRKKRQEEQGER